MAPIQALKSPIGRRSILAAALVLALATQAKATLVEPGPVDLQVVDRDTGRALPVWRHHGRLCIAGEPGTRYSLRVANHTSGRVLVGLSVDGGNIITGQTAGYGPRGYVLNPFQSY